MSAARSLDAAMKWIDEIRERQAKVIAEWDAERRRDVERETWLDCACEPDESCQECDAA